MLAARQDRILLTGRQHRHRFETGQGEGTGDVDSFPPGSFDTEVTRTTPPRTNGPGRVAVRSILGLGVTVTIMRYPEQQSLPVPPW